MNLLPLPLPLLVCALLVLSGCATTGPAVGSPQLGAPEHSTGLSLVPTPCGTGYQARAAGGVPLVIPVGSWEVIIEAAGDASVTMRPGCPQEPALQPTSQPQEVGHAPAAN